jgi:hypothetical protein
MKEIKGLIDDITIDKIKKSQSITYRRVGFSALMMYFQLMKDYENSYIYSRELYYLSERYTEFFTKYSFKSSIIIYNYLYSCIASKHFIEFEENIKHYDDQKLSNEPQVKSHKFHMLYTLYFTYIIAKKDYALFFQHQRKFEKEYKQYIHQLNPWYQANLINLVSRLLFLNGKIEEAIEWINSGIKLSGETMREESRIVIQIQDIIFHYELGKFAELEGKLFSARRNLRNSSPFFNAEQCLISYVYQLIRADNEKEKTTIFKRFKKDIKAIFAKNTEEQAILESFDIIEWIDTNTKQATDNDMNSTISIVA